MGGKGKGKGGASAGRSPALEAGGSSPKVMAAAGPTGSLVASSAEAPGDVKLKAKAAAASRDLKLKAKAAEVAAADDLVNSAPKIKAKAAAADDLVNSKQAALKIKAKSAAADDLVISKQTALKNKTKSAAPESLKIKVKEAATAGKIKKSGVPKATLKSRLSVVAEADKSEGEEEHYADEEVEEDSEEDPDYDPEDDSVEDPDYDPAEDSDGDDPDDDDFDIINTVAELRALLAQGPIVRGIRVDHVPSTHQAADLYDALFEVKMPPGMSIARMEPLRHLKLGRQRVLTDILSGSILRLRNRPHSQTTKARLRRQARSLKGTARAVRGDFRARAEYVADQLTAFANRVNEPKNSPDLNQLRLVVHGLLNDPVSFQV